MIHCRCCKEPTTSEIWAIPKIGLICKDCLEIIHKSIHDIKEKTGKECIDADPGRGEQIRTYVIEAKIIKVSSEVQEVQDRTKSPSPIHGYEDR